MTLAASSPTQPTPVDALSPLRFPGDLQLTPEQFWAVCSANPDAVLELDASGHLIHMTPPAEKPAPAIKHWEPCFGSLCAPAALRSSCSTAPAAFACPMALC